MKSILLICSLLFIPSLHAQNEQLISYQEEPEYTQIMDSLMIIRPGIADFGDMKVREFVNRAISSKMDNGEYPKVIGWSKSINNTYTLKVQFNKLFTFIYILSDGFVTLDHMTIEKLGGDVVISDDVELVALIRMIAAK